MLFSFFVNLDFIPKSQFLKEFFEKILECHHFFEKVHEGFDNQRDNFCRKGEDCGKNAEEDRAHQGEIDSRADEHTQDDINPDLPFAGPHRKIEQHKEAGKADQNIAEHRAEQAPDLETQGFEGVVQNTENQPSRKRAEGCYELGVNRLFQNLFKQAGPEVAARSGFFIAQIGDQPCHNKFARIQTQLVNVQFASADDEVAL